MKMTYCDACGADASVGASVGVPCHLYSKRSALGYVDRDMNRVSGRSDHLDLCNACLNRAYSAMVDKILEIQRSKEGAK